MGAKLTPSNIFAVVERESHHGQQRQRYCWPRQHEEGKIAACANGPPAMLLEIVALGRDDGQKLDAQVLLHRMATMMVCAVWGKCGGSGVTHLIDSKEEK